jgi:hypothetical protein
VRVLIVLGSALVATLLVFGLTALLDSALSGYLSRLMLDTVGGPLTYVCGHSIDPEAESVGFDSLHWRGADCRSLSRTDRCALRCFSTMVASPDAGGCYAHCEGLRGEGGLIP